MNVSIWQTLARFSKYKETHIDLLCKQTLTSVKLYRIHSQITMELNQKLLTKRELLNAKGLLESGNYYRYRFWISQNLQIKEWKQQDNKTKTHGQHLQWKQWQKILMNPQIPASEEKSYSLKTAWYHHLLRSSRGKQSLVWHHREQENAKKPLCVPWDIAAKTLDGFSHSNSS